MKKDIRLGVVLLAAGRSSRFGTNKLLADFDDRPMVCQTMDAIGEIHAASVAVVSGCEHVAQLARSYGYGVVTNEQPELGQSHSIRLGVSAVRDMDAALLLAADQPLLTSDSLRALLEEFIKGGKEIACLRDETHMGNPAVFARRYFGELELLEGDRGAKGVLRAHEDDLLVVRCLHPGELADADTPQALAAMRNRAGL